MDLDAIRNMRLPTIEQAYDRRETILYALGLGYGGDPLDTDELPFVYEGQLRSVPSMVNVLCHPGFWVQRPEYKVDWVKVLHAEQDFQMHATLPPTGKMRGNYHVKAVEDKGAERGALLHQEKELHDLETGELIATVRSTLFLRGDGGQGGFGEAPAPAAALPEGEASRSLTIKTAPDQALIYRLSGDWNPLHADPEIARKAGFPQPILQGLCTNGVACRAILATYCNNDTARLRRMFTRFSSPVMPGETIRFDFFEKGDGVVTFRATAEERGKVVLDRCVAQVS